MNRTIRIGAFCAVLTVVAATGWGKPSDKVLTSTEAAPKVSSRPVAMTAVKATATPEVKPPVVSSAVKSAANPVAHSPAVMQKALRALDGGVAADADNGSKYTDDGTRLVSCDPKAVVVTIKKGVRLIYGNAFRGCKDLLRLHFLGDAPSVADEAFADLPRGCTIYVEKGSKGWPSGNPCEWKGIAVRISDEIKNVPMELDGQVKLDGVGYCVKACGDGVALFADPKDLSKLSAATLVVPEKIGNAPVLILGDSVFPSCTNLTKVVIPASVTNFSLAAFSRCGRPRQIEIAAGNPAYREVDGAVYEVSSRTVILAGTDVSTVRVPADALAIGSEAFKGCDLLTSVELPPALKSIDKDAFAGCMGLSVVTVPVEAEVADAFEGCCATIRRVGSYCHYDGFAGTNSVVRWMPDEPSQRAEGPFSEVLPIGQAVGRAAKGDGDALYSLAVHCARGCDVKHDPVRAMEYLKQAVAAKSANAEFLLGLVLESRMTGSDLNEPAALGIAGRFVPSSTASASESSKLAAGTPFEKYVGVSSFAFANLKGEILVPAGSLANEKDYELVRGVYESAFRGGCLAAGARLEHLSYLSKLELERVEKDANQRLLDGLQRK